MGARALWHRAPQRRQCALQSSSIAHYGAPHQALRPGLRHGHSGCASVVRAGALASSAPLRCR
eukprot:10124825-Alexandrium_andersonii.AAC.1